MPKPNSRACMISGSPGIGKSTSVRLIARELGYNVIEFNASDNRSKKFIDNLIKDMSTSNSMDYYN